MKVCLYLSVLCNKLVLSAWCAYIQVLPTISLYALITKDMHLKQDLSINSYFIFNRFNNRREYAEAVRQFKLQELESRDRMRAVKCGIGSVIPLETLSIFTASDLDLRVCGIPDVDLKYLKVREEEMKYRKIEVIGGRE